MEAFNIEKEIRDLVSFPDEKYLNIIREVGFVCDRCGKCCTSEFNDHIFLLDDDAKRIIDNHGHEYLRPAPYFDLSDNLGRFYVMGYALKTKPNGDCIFYTGSSCEHYEDRPRICNIYPYMLHREPDEDGNIDFRQIGGLDEHGLYHNEMGEETCKEILKTVKEYESGFLRQQFEFIKYVENYFKENNLKTSQQMYDRMMRLYQKGTAIEVYVFYQGGFEKEVISRYDKFENGDVFRNKSGRRFSKERSSPMKEGKHQKHKPQIRVNLRNPRHPRSIRLDEYYFLIPDKC